MYRSLTISMLLPIVIILQGCVVSHDEISHLKSSGDSSNYFRVEVSSNAFMTGSSYSSGLYDERALDIFLNEHGTNSSDSVNEVKVPSKKDYKTKEDGKKNKTAQPLKSTGVYAYIFSTDADDISNTIGAFADNQVVADHIVALLNQDKLEKMQEEDLRIEMNLAQSASVFKELQDLVAEIPVDQPTSSNPNLSSYYSLLNAIARALGSNRRFESFESAREFFDGLAAK